VLRSFSLGVVRSAGRGGGLLALGVLSCSFYTDCPCANDPPAPNNPASGAGGGGGTSAATGGGGTGGGTGGTTGGTDAGGGNGGAPDPPPMAEWARSTGDLAGRSAACGNVNFMSAKSDEDLLILNVHQNGLWGSRDGGEHWDALGASTESALVLNIPTGIVYDPDESDRFWEVGIYGPGVFRTDDNGETFIQLPDITHNDGLSIDFTDPDRNVMLAGGHEQSATLFQSLDGGESWNEIGAALPEECQHSSYPFVLDRDNYLLGCKNIIIGTRDGGESWEVRSGYGGSQAPLLSSDGLIYWAIDTSGGLVKSSDNGDTFERVVGGGVVTNMTPIELPDGSLAMLGGKSIVRSTDEGVSWDAISPELTFNPGGLIYSRERGAFYAWQSTCEAKIPDDAIMRFDSAF
jgi:photosystem II stability/assembly factor-like uncharacterized protein